MKAITNRRIVIKRLTTALFICASLTISSITAIATPIRAEAQPGDVTYKDQIGRSGGRLINPRASAVASDGTLYVADSGNNRIQKFSANGTYISQFGTAGSGDGQFQIPYDITIDTSGNLYVADTGNDRIQKFSANGQYLSQFGTQGTGDGQFNQPFGIAIDTSGNLYVADAFNNRIQKFSASGQYLSQFGTQGTGDGQFNQPYGITADTSGNLYVADTNNNRIQKFSADGTYQSQFGTAGTGDGQFDYPFGIAIDSTGNLYVADVFNSRIQKFSANGTYLSQFGTAGSGDGQFGTPVSVSIDYSGLLLVADQGNNRIQIFQIEQPPKPTAEVNNMTLKGDPTIMKRPTFSGTAAPGSTVTVTVRSDPIVCTTTADAQGNWSCTLPSDIPPGDHTVTIALVTPDGATTNLGPYAVRVAGNGSNSGQASPASINNGTPLAPNTGVGLLLTSSWLTTFIPITGLLVLAVIMYRKTRADER